MNPNNPPPRGDSGSGGRLVTILAIGCLLVTLLFILARPRARPNSAAPADGSATGNPPTPMAIAHSGRGRDLRQLRGEPALPAFPAEEIVAEKISQFAHNRQELVAAMAKQLKVTVPEEVNRFFAAAAAGRWQETTNLYTALQKLRMSDDRPPGLEKLWPAILETYGAAEQAHLWPAQKLLDYGNAVIDALRPGMVYVGGTDAGRFIPTLLTDTGTGEPHIVLTQNALADGTYLEYLKFRYGDRLNTLTSDDSQASFQAYIADAQKRVLHDQQFPDEPKQVRPGEDIRIDGGRVQVTGQVAVMLINEQLLQTLLQKNPDLSFALQESFPLQSLYPGATPLGPITELRANDPANALTADHAAQTLDYWRTTTQSLLADTDAASAPRDAFAKLILGQANLLSARFPGEAEQALQLALQLSPTQTETITTYANLLLAQGRSAEARRLLQAAVNNAPNNQSLTSLLGKANQTQ